MMMRLILTIKFSIYGLLFFPVAVAIDMFVFFYNLYTEASVDTMNDKSKQNFSKEGI